MTAWGEFLCSYHLPVLFAEQNDGQFEEINVVDESQAENRFVPMLETEIRCEITTVTKTKSQQS